MGNKSNTQLIYIAVIVLLLLAVVGEYFYFKNKLITAVRPMGNYYSANPTMPPAGPNARGRGGPPMMMSKGMNLKTSPLFKYAYQIAPGDLSDSTKQALVGWTVSSKNQADGSLLVTLTPKDSSDQYQEYVIKSGQTLYFIEQTPSDDKQDQDQDLNYRDDYGIIVDSSGIIQ